MSLLMCVDCGDVVHCDLFPCDRCTFGPCGSHLCNLISEKLRDIDLGICDICHEKRKRAHFQEIAYLVHVLDISKVHRKKVKARMVEALIGRFDLRDQQGCIKALLSQVKFADDSVERVRRKENASRYHDARTSAVLRNYRGHKKFSYRNR